MILLLDFGQLLALLQISLETLCWLVPLCHDEPTNYSSLGCVDSNKAQFNIFLLLGVQIWLQLAKDLLNGCLLYTSDAADE